MILLSTTNGQYWILGTNRTLWWNTYGQSIVGNLTSPNNFRTHLERGHTGGEHRRSVKSSIEFRVSICRWEVIKVAAQLKKHCSLLASWLLGTCFRLLARTKMFWTSGNHLQSKEHKFTWYNIQRWVNYSCNSWKWVDALWNLTKLTKYNTQMPNCYFETGFNTI